MNNGLSHTVNKLVGIVFGILVVGFTSYNTWRLLYDTSSNAIVATLGLVLFEGGMLYWLSTFQTTANGLLQMAVSLVVFVLCLVMVSIANAVELGAVNMALDTTLPNRLIVVAAVIHLIAKTTYPLLSPTKAREIANRTLEGRIIGMAEKALSDKASEIASDVADQLATEWRGQLLQTMSNQHRLSLDIPQLVSESAETRQKRPVQPISGGDGQNHTFQG